MEGQYTLMVYLPDRALLALVIFCSHGPYACRVIAAKSQE
jgi:hypothetical protein